MADDLKVETPQRAKEMLPFNVRIEHDLVDNIERVFDAETNVEIAWRTFEGGFYEHWFGKYPAKFYTMSGSVEAAINDVIGEIKPNAAEAMTSSEAEFEGLIGAEVQSDDDDRKSLSEAGETASVEPYAEDAEGSGSVSVPAAEVGVESTPEAACVAQEECSDDDAAEVSEPVSAEGSPVDAAEPEEDASAKAPIENPLTATLGLVMAMHGGQPIPSAQLSAADRAFCQLIAAIAEGKLESMHFSTTNGLNIGWQKPETVGGAA